VPDPLLDVRGLRTWFHTEDGIVKAVDDLSIQLHAGQTLGIVGESGSGKSVTSLTLMRLLPDAGAQIAGGKAIFLGRDLLTLSQVEMSAVRGREIAMIFQEPMTSLNPVFRVGDQVAEAVMRHRKVSRAAARERVLDLFREVGIPDPERRIDAWPHEMSGGQKQRVMIAMALACDPKLLIADEPTTALDVTIQAQILDLIRSLRDRRNMAVIFITHDLGVIAEIADHVGVMFRGRLVEYGDVESIFEMPAHPYTRGLLACRPRLDTPYRILPTIDDFMEAKQINGELVVTERPADEARMARLLAGNGRRSPEASAPPILKVEDLTVKFAVGHNVLGTPNRWFTAVDRVSFDVLPGETLGLVGESGCGKTTVGRTIVRLVEPSGGKILFRGEDVRALSAGALKKIRRKVQIVFQDPYASLNPRLTVEQAVTEPMLVHRLGGSTTDRRKKAEKLLDEVGLEARHLRRYPHEFSGGQRQRICIARALAVEPEFLICDESVSALDVSVQAQVLNLLKDLQERHGLTYIFISHDLSVVKFMSDRMCVMRGGQIVERGTAESVYAAPVEEYTRNLIAAIPRDDLEHIRARRAARGLVT
jgi:peptide/nickel transport system ATP-binding protein